MRRMKVVDKSYADGLQVLITGTGATLFCFNRAPIQHTEVLAELAASNHRAGTEAELEKLCSKEPNLKARFDIIALGKPFEDSDGVKFVAARLGGEAALLPLRGRVGRGWNKEDRFLAFHK